MTALSRQIADTARFTAVHAALVPEEETSLPWLVTGAVVMVQQACVLALSEAGADIPAMPGPAELVARVADPAYLAQPYTAPLRGEHHRAFGHVIAARNQVMHPRPGGLDIDPADLPEGILVAAALVRHLILTQPVRPSMVEAGAAGDLAPALALIETSVDFWQTVIAA